MRKKRLLRNIIITIFYQFVLIISGFAISRAIILYYGSEINGLISSINQFFIYFSLVELGLTSASIYALYKPLVEKNYHKVNSIVAATKNLYLKSGYIFILMLIILALFYPIFVKVDKLHFVEILFLILILGSNKIVDFFSLSKYRVIIIANERTDIISLASIIYIIIFTLIIIITSYFRFHIVIVRLIAIFSILIRSVILFIYVRKKFKYLDFTVDPDYSAISMRKDAMYLQILGTVHTSAPIILLTLMTRNLYLVSIYSVYSLIINGINGIMNMITEASYPTFGHIISEKNEYKLMNSYRIFETLYYFLLTIIYAITIVTIQSFVKIYTIGITDADYSNIILSMLFVINGYFFALKNPQGMLVMSAGLYKETRLQTTIQGSIVVIGSIILIPFFNIYGVLIASIASNFYRLVDLSFFIPKKVTHLPIKNSLLTIFISISIILSIFLISHLINYTVDNNYLTWISYAILIAFVSLTITLLSFFFIKKKDMMFIFNYIQRVAYNIKKKR